jgi:uncharacterized protein YlaI
MIVRCIICNRNFSLSKGDGVRYRNKPICDRCLLTVAFIYIDKKKEEAKRHITNEVILESYST